MAEVKPPETNPKRDPDRDGYTDPVHPETRTASQSVSAGLEIGTAGLRKQGGFVHEEFLTNLSGGKAKKIFREMSYNDDVVSAVMHAFDTLLRQVRWMVEAADESAEAIEGKEFLEEVLDDMETGMSEVMSEISTMFVYGFAPMEVIYKRRRGDGHRDPRYHSKYNDNAVGLRTMSLRAQSSVESWDFTSDDYVKGFVQRTFEGKQAYIPRERFLLFRTTTVNNNPEGRSLLRGAYRSWYYKKRIQEIEAIGVERDLAGIPVLRIPSEYMRADASDEHKAIFTQYQNMVTQVVRDENEGLILPSDRDPDKGNNYLIEFELLKGGSSRQFNTNEIIQRYNQAIGMSVLADFVLMGHKAVGSFALSDNKTEMFKASLGAFLNSIEDVINRQLVPVLWRLNGRPMDLMPRYIHEDVDSPSVEVLGTFLSNLNQAGATGKIDRDFVNAVRRVANLPLQDDEMPEELEFPNMPQEQPQMENGDADSQPPNSNQDSE